MATLTLAALLAAYIAVNHSWMHAALAGLSGPSDCPASLEAKAHKNVVAFFGEATAAPILICLKQPRLGLHVSHGSTRFAPLLPSIVILGPYGENEDVASHEMAHAELAARTSVLLRTYRIPTWFDEGLAMQVDHRADYSNAALADYFADKEIVPLGLVGLSDPAGFFRAGRQGKANYAFAKCVVGRWLSADGDLQRLIAETGWLKAFPTQPFEVFAAECLIGSR